MAACPAAKYIVKQHCNLYVLWTKWRNLPQWR